MAPPAPGRFWIRKLCPRSSLMERVRIRARTSAPPPAGKGTTSLMILLGYGCAATRPGAQISVARTTKSATAFMGHRPKDAMSARTHASPEVLDLLLQLNKVIARYCTMVRVRHNSAALL